MFWLLAIALTLTVALAILWPFWRANAAVAEPAAAYDLRIYRDQLTEVDRDLSRGIISPVEAERLRVEIGRKVLSADQQFQKENRSHAASRRYGILAAVVLGVLIGGGWLVYARIGSPDDPDMALKSRIAQAEARYAARSSQAAAEAAQPEQAPGPQPDAEFAALMTELREGVATRPNDVRGLTLLARYEARLGNTLAAKQAQSRLIEAKGDAATAADHALLAGFMTEAAGGLITPEAEAEVQRALQLDPDNPQARYMIGLLQAQNGRPDRAFPVWAALLEDTPPESPWNQAIAAVIEDIAWLAGQPDYQPPQSAAPPGPDAETMQAAADMSPEERQAFVRNMVEQLETRLGTEGGTPDEWARLISSLGVLGDMEHAQEIYAEAQSLFSEEPDALAPIQAAAQQAGLTE
ncbi:c-type cytochrome biogenesis protein CcmI [Paracoccus albus]|uniref:c-type cytochrome biogenesis protein CcmI n=1 Tax=Paracoccus albus TaxID=3017784 RepID=UPI0022F02750|nr:c-type cytochrome biogenesis protein CcmI [Paracoccus albus]WBU60668.1 c-type cytochrome biogenesis protein CcmI [Paracoccus albus]